MRPLASSPVLLPPPSLPPFLPLRPPPQLLCFISSCLALIPQHLSRPSPPPPFRKVFLNFLFFFFKPHALSPCHSPAFSLVPYNSQVPIKGMRGDVFYCMYSLKTSRNASYSSPVFTVWEEGEKLFWQ